MQWKNSPKNLLTLFITVFIVAGESFGLPYEAELIQLQPTQQQYLESNNKVRSVTLQKNRLWALTDKGLYLLDLVSNNIQKVNIPRFPNKRYMKTLDSNQVDISLITPRLVAIKAGKIHILIENGKLIPLPLPGKREIRSIQSEDEGYSIVDKTYIHYFSSSHKYQGFQKLPTGFSEASFHLKTSKSTFLTMSKSLLSSNSFNSKTPIWNNIFESIAKIKKLTMLDSKIALVTSIGLTLFNEHGDVLQSIPIRGQSKIVSANFSPRNHDYLLSNKSLMRYNVGLKQRFEIKLPLGRVKKVRSFEISDTYCTGIFDERLAIFKFPQFK